jgi:hypothetical protein
MKWSRECLRVDAVEIGVYEVGRLVLAAGEQVAVAVERDADRRVPHERRERLGFHVCGN